MFFPFPQVACVQWKWEEHWSSVALFDIQRVTEMLTKPITNEEEVDLVHVHHPDHDLDPHAETEEGDGPHHLHEDIEVPTDLMLLSETNKQKEIVTEQSKERNFEAMKKRMIPNMNMELA
jgi:hypothetical protein